MAKKEFKVGETFQFGFIKLKCEKELCTGCYFHKSGRITMRLTFRERITYIIYTEPYSNAGITIDKFLEIARSIIGVVYPHFINDEIVVTLYSGNVRVDTDYYTSTDNERYEAGNYCRFEDELVPYARQVKEIYKKLK